MAMRRAAGTMNRSEVFPERRVRGWTVAVGGAALAVGTMEIALTLGLSDATGVGDSALRLLALLLGAVIACTRAARALWIAAAAATVLLLVVMFTPIVERPALSLLRADADGERPDAIVVFSAAMTDAGHIADVGLTRLVSGLDDARVLGVPHVLVSEQTRLIRGRAVSTAPDQQRIAALLGGGVQLHSVTNVSNTYNESLAFAAYARTRGWTHVRAVTSPLHTTRACAALEATGLTVTCAPATSRNVAFTRLGTPTARLVVLRAALHEAVGLVVYRWRGWL